MSIYTQDEARIRDLYNHMRAQYTGDANGTLFFARQLELVESQIYRVLYAQYKAREVFPVKSEGGDWTKDITYRVFDSVGRARLMNHNANDTPRISVKTREITHKVAAYTDSYAYTTRELAAAQHTGLNIDVEMGLAARESVEKALEEAAWFGENALGIVGFLNNSQIPRGNVPNGVGGNSQF